MAAEQLPERTRVLVIGGGPVGLVVSGLLSQRGVEHVVIERRRETQRAPAAHVMRRRPMEILDALGVGEEVRRAVPPLPLDFITWCTTLGGAGGRPARPPAGRSRDRRAWARAVDELLPEPARADPAAARIASEAGTHRARRRVRRDRARRWLRHGSRALRGRRASSASRPTGPSQPTVPAARCGACWASRWKGSGPLGRFFMVHFEADLVPWVQHRSGPLFFILNPESPGCLIVHDPKRSHVFMMPRRGSDERRGDDPGAAGRRRSASRSSRRSSPSTNGRRTSRWPRATARAASSWSATQRTASRRPVGWASTPASRRRTTS